MVKRNFSLPQMRSLPSTQDVIFSERPSLKLKFRRDEYEDARNAWMQKVILSGQHPNLGGNRFRFETQPMWKIPMTYPNKQS